MYAITLYNVILPRKFCIQKFGGKNWEVTWPNWWHQDVALPWFFRMHIFVFWKNPYFYVITPIMSRFWHENGRSPKFRGNFFGHVTNLMCLWPSSPMGLSRPYFCFSQKSTFLVVMGVNSWALHTKQKQKQKKPRANPIFSQGVWLPALRFSGSMRTIWPLI